MVGFRVTKYDPRYRLPNGAYGRNEWTEAGDAGRVCDGEPVTCTEYMRVETAYVGAVRSFLDAAGVEELKVSRLEVGCFNSRPDPCGLWTGDSRARLETIVDGSYVRGDDLDWVVRLALRDELWCQLLGKDGFYVDFAGEYYMFVGSDVLSAVPPPMPEGIFAEVFDSPCRPDDDDEKP